MFLAEHNASSAKDNSEDEERSSFRSEGIYENVEEGSEIACVQTSPISFHPWKRDLFRGWKEIGDVCTQASSESTRNDSLSKESLSYSLLENSRDNSMSEESIPDSLESRSAKGF